MTTVTPVKRPPLVWLVIATALSLVAIGVLWPLQQVGQVCILIYPSPPGCGAGEPRWVSIAGIVLVIALLAAIFVVYFTVAHSRTILILLTAGIVVVTALTAGIVLLTQSGWYPYPPGYLE